MPRMSIGALGMGCIRRVSMMRIPDYRVWVKAEKKMYGIEYDGFVDYIRACGEPDAFGIDVQIIDEDGMYQSFSFDEV